MMPAASIAACSIRSGCGATGRGSPDVGDPVDPLSATGVVVVVTPVRSAAAGTAGVAEVDVASRVEAGTVRRAFSAP